MSLVLLDVALLGFQDSRLYGLRWDSLVGISADECAPATRGIETTMSC